MTKALRLVDDLFELADGNRALFAGAEQTAEHLLALEFLAPSVLLHHHVWDFVDALVGGVALFAAQALAAAANRFAFLALARVNHLILIKSAKGTFHGAVGADRPAAQPFLSKSASCLLSLTIVSAGLYQQQAL